MKKRLIHEPSADYTPEGPQHHLPYFGSGKVLKMPRGVRNLKHKKMQSAAQMDSQTTALTAQSSRKVLKALSPQRSENNLHREGSKSSLHSAFQIMPSGSTEMKD